MRLPMNTVSPLMLCWCAVYVLALFSVFVAGILARSRPARSPAKPVRSKGGFSPWATNQQSKTQNRQ